MLDLGQKLYPQNGKSLSLFYTYFATEAILIESLSDPRGSLDTDPLTFMSDLGLKYRRYFQTFSTKLKKRFIFHLSKEY